MECHKDITARVLDGRGLHATFVSKNTKSNECVKCHSEHNGENFNLVRWDPSPGKFEHSKTGYNLEGKHAALQCKRCHNAGLIPPKERERIVALKNTYLGLSRECVSCHEDKHKGQLGNDCQRCHNSIDWKVAKQFDHSRTRYPLTGSHAVVACQKCHTLTAVGTTEVTPRYRGIPFGECTSCHVDPHKGAFQQNCQSCHTTAGWKRVKLEGNFDHAKTKFALMGKHLEVGCTKCHAGGDFKKPLTFAQCTDCHKDPHAGQFAKRRDGGRCESCHSVDGWKGQSKFGVAEHRSTGYPLEGKHTEVPCAKCHIPAGAATQYKIKFALCTDCHRDQHEAQFAAAPHNNRCERCHTVAGFRPSTFGLNTHKQARFLLTGGHVAVACGDCHKPEIVQGPTPVAKYRFGDFTCTACHSDPHRGQFSERMSKKAASGTSAGCEACHSTKSWRELSKFDHSATSYPLTGSHRAVQCINCHKPPNLELTLKNVDFRRAPQACEACHQDVHDAQFAKSDGVTACADCHNTMKWRPSIFDHETRTPFSLRGAHQNVRCALCHTAKRMVEGRAVVVYKPTPKKCADCHGATIPENRG